jgi:hypothetical protein
VPRFKLLPGYAKGMLAEATSSVIFSSVILIETKMNLHKILRFYKMKMFGDFSQAC